MLLHQMPLVKMKVLVHQRARVKMKVLATLNHGMKGVAALVFVKQV
jgi:hypothetical protein